MTQVPPQYSVVDQLRAHWQQAIAELGSAAAAEDGARALAQRSACSLEEGRAHVTRAWQLLAISDSR